MNPKSCLSSQVSSLQSRVSSLQFLRSPPGLRAGFTLVEMLVVLLILGLLAGMVTLVAQPDDRGLLRVEAQRLARLMDLAVTESGLTGKSIGWTADAVGYRFWRYRADTGWSEIRDSDLLRARALPQGMTFASLRVENGQPQNAFRLEFSPYGPPPPFVIELALGAERYGVAASPMGEVRAVAVVSRTDG